MWEKNVTGRSVNVLSLDKLERTQLIKLIGERGMGWGGEESRFVGCLIYTIWESKTFLPADKSSNSTNTNTKKENSLKLGGKEEEEKYFHVISHSREQLIISKEIDN